MAMKVTRVVPRKDVTEDMLVEAAALFSENYGIWGVPPPGERALGKPGNRVKMNAARLRQQCLPDGSDSVYVYVKIGDVLAGHAFACRWPYQEHQVLWITQLVVHAAFRERRIATTLLLSCFGTDDDVFGILSSHPAACKALAKAFGSVNFSEIPLDFAKSHAQGIMSGSPIQYIRDAELCGRVLNPEDSTGMILGVNSHFHVDHAEPLEALHTLQDTGEWPLGDLPDGHEYLCLFQQPQRRYSSASSRKCAEPA